MRTHLHCDYDYAYDYDRFTFDPSLLPINSVTHVLDSVLEPVTKMANNVLDSVLELCPPSWEHDAHAQCCTPIPHDDDHSCRPTHDKDERAQRSSEWDTTKESLRAFANELSARKPLKPVRQIKGFNELPSSSESHQQSVQRQDRSTPLARRRQHLARNALALDAPVVFRTRQCAGDDSEPFPTGGPYFGYFPATLAKETMQKDVSMYVERVVCRSVYMHSATLYY